MTRKEFSDSVGISATALIILNCEACKKKVGSGLGGTLAYIALQNSCAHESYTLNYQGSNSRFYCTNHWACFSNIGSVLNDLALKSLKAYNTTHTGSSLRVYSKSI
jgi:cytochrome b6-f complex iron-sulfur subunit